MNKYRSHPAIPFPQRSWPSKSITNPPLWCSVDLRDGNQALIDPMTPEQKLQFFAMLSAIGFKDIEISFPSASEADFQFTRRLIDEGHIPEGTRIQVLTQAREHLINKTFQAVRGAPEVIVHMYTSTSPAQREVVFNKSPSELIAMTVESTMMIRERAAKHNGAVTLEYSPESFSQTEPDFACDICNAVIDAWNPQQHEKVIINLPATVEITSPNLYADMVEYVLAKLIRREQVVTSIHTHNDRGCAVAAAELGILAGADRVEGTLFGNGERTGNADLVTLALNMFSQGIETGLNFSDIEGIVATYSACTDMQVPARHPYAGSLVFTAFSGSHQDAISKGLAAHKETNGIWQVPYLPIDPKDIGRTYESIIRINSQSGKGGSSWILQQMYQFELPRAMHGEVGKAIQRVADFKEKELSAEEVYRAFKDEFINRAVPLRITECKSEPIEPTGAVSSKIRFKATLHKGESTSVLEGTGNGIIDALTHALNSSGFPMMVNAYVEHSMGSGSDAQAVAYTEVVMEGKHCFGVGTNTDISQATIAAVVSALNRLLT